MKLPKYEKEMRQRRTIRNEDQRLKYSMIIMIFLAMVALGIVYWMVKG